MSHDAVWGAALIAYLVPWALWAARQPDMGDTSTPEAKRATQVGLGLTAGFVALLVLGWVTR